MHGRYRETDRQTDRQDYYGNTALCTSVHRAVKKLSAAEPFARSGKTEEEVYCISRESLMTRNVSWSRASVCLSVHVSASKAK